jgi:SAM-dependent methyltransferase
VSHPEVDRLAEKLAPTLFNTTVARARAEFGEVWEVELGGTIERVFPGNAINTAAGGYEKFCLEIMRLQVAFEQTGRYAPFSYDEMQTLVYQNDDYMRTTYLPGLLLAWYLWPHHYRQVQFFKQAFVRDMSRHGAAKFIEVATGTGLYSRLALKGALGTVGVGYDIGPASLQFTHDHVAAYGATARYETRRANVMEERPNPVDWLICVELLEHLEDPMVLLRTLRQMLNPGGKAFIATAINAPNSDHIWLYETTDEVTAQLRRAGFTVEQACVNPSESNSEKPPTVAAFICR